MSAGMTRPARATAIGLAVSVVFTTFVVWMVNALIYVARWDFSAFHPERVVNKPPTISRAIEDPRIGVPFAEWMAICAPVLLAGVALLVWYAWSELRRNGSADGATLRRIARFSVVLVLLQAMASVGMIILSHYRFPDHHGMHMAGSYLFFFSQALVVFTGQLLSNAYGRLPPEGRVILPVMVRFRRAYIWVPVALAFVYLGCFVLKDFDLGALKSPLYVVYTSTEPVLLSSFLFYVFSYAPDCIATVVRYVRGASSVAA
ncbi:MAG: hypothetical protein ACU0A6_15325 [Shimia sp.]|jgi:hypothetical protein|uniref:hypothetical protein n=1 Tax=Shimia sp. TaxID=1954381 RepID=UPI00405A3B78